MTQQKDTKIDGSLVEHINRAASQYPTELGSQSFELVDIEHEKDQMINIARLHARQEYDRIMQLVEVLQQQAAEIKTRLDMTDHIHAAEYAFVPQPGHSYWLLWDSASEVYRLSMTGPDEWSAGIPENYSYVDCVTMLGDYTWVVMPKDYK